MALFVATFTFFESGTGVAGQRASCWRSSLGGNSGQFGNIRIFLTA